MPYIQHIRATFAIAEPFGHSTAGRLADGDADVYVDDDGGGGRTLCAFGGSRAIVCRWRVIVSENAYVWTIVVEFTSQFTLDDTIYADDEHADEMFYSTREQF